MDSVSVINMVMMTMMMMMTLESNQAYILSLKRYYAALLPRRAAYCFALCLSVCLSVCPSVCPSVPLSYVTERHVAPPSELQ